MRVGASSHVWLLARALLAHLHLLAHTGQQPLAGGRGPQVDRHTQGWQGHAGHVLHGAGCTPQYCPAQRARLGAAVYVSALPSCTLRAPAFPLPIARSLLCPAMDSSHPLPSLICRNYSPRECVRSSIPHISCLPGPLTCLPLPAHLLPAWQGLQARHHPLLLPRHHVAGCTHLLAPAARPARLLLPHSPARVHATVGACGSGRRGAGVVRVAGFGGREGGGQACCFKWCKVG